MDMINKGNLQVEHKLKQDKVHPFTLTQPATTTLTIPQSTRATTMPNRSLHILPKDKRWIPIPPITMSVLFQHQRD